MNKAKQLLAGLEILKDYGMEELQLTPINTQCAFNTNFEQSRSAYLSIHIPFKESLRLEYNQPLCKALIELGWVMEQDCEYWIFRD